jgi:methionyl-tRNA formyltransferase
VALEYGKTIYQPKKIAELLPVLLGLKPDIIIVAAYAKIIPESILSIPKYGCINVHGSLLPKYRGASCISAAIINGDKETGITIMKMDKGLDTGPVLAQAKIKIASGDTTGCIYEKLRQLAAPLLTGTIKKYVAGGLKPIAQDGQSASACPILKKEDGQIDWNKSAEFNERFIRAMDPWPGAFADIKKHRLKIIAVEPKVYDLRRARVGELFTQDEKLFAQLADGALSVLKIQPEGKKVMNAKSFVNGYQKLIN